MTKVVDPLCNTIYVFGLLPLQAPNLCITTQPLGLFGDKVQEEIVSFLVVIFNTTDFSYHGHPEPLKCPDGVMRNSLALYYYSTTGN